MCDPNNHKSYGLGLTVVTEVYNIVFYILENIIVIFYQRLYNILYICLWISDASAKCQSSLSHLQSDVEIDTFLWNKLLLYILYLTDGLN